MKVAHSVLFLSLVAYATVIGCSRSSRTTAGDAVSLRAIDLEQYEALVHSSSRKLLVVNFWASWCPPCLTELPYFVNARTKYLDRDVNVLFVSVDSDSELPSVKEILKKEGVDWTSYHRSGDANSFISSVHREWSGALPATVVYGPGGELRDFWEGAVQEAELEKKILALLQDNEAPGAHEDITGPGAGETEE
jgi:thiol-disulfide isomerase/thioredoxin